MRGVREQPFDFYGGGEAKRLRNKKFPALNSGKKNSPTRRAGQKNSPARLRKCFRTPKPVFAFQNPPFAVRNLLSQSKICFSHYVNCFTHSKSTLYLWNDFLNYKKEVFLGKRNILKKILVFEEPGCRTPPPPPLPHGLMKRALGGLKKKKIRPNGPAKKILLL